MKSKIIILLGMLVFLGGTGSSYAYVIPSPDLEKYVKALDMALPRTFSCENETYTAHSEIIRKDYKLVSGELNDNLSQPVIILKWEHNSDAKTFALYSFTTDSTFKKIVHINTKLMVVETTNVGTIVSPNFQEIPVLKKEFNCPL